MLNFAELREREVRILGILGSSPPEIATHLTKIRHLADALASHAPYEVNEAGGVTLPIGFAPGSHLSWPRCYLLFSAQRGLQCARGLVANDVHAAKLIAEVPGPVCGIELILRAE